LPRGLHTGSRDRRNYFGERRRLPRCWRIGDRRHSPFSRHAGHVLCGAVSAEADTLISIVEVSVVILQPKPPPSAESRIKLAKRTPHSPTPIICTFTPPNFVLRL